MYFRASIRPSVAAASLAALALSAGSASAGILSSNINQNIFGANYGISIYRVANDIAGQGPSGSTAGRLEPEGMVFHNGTLYVSGDGSSAETNGFLAAYSGGNIAGPATALGRFTATVGANTAAFGPEGITVNTRSSGYGSFSGSTPRIIGADNVVSPVSARVTATYNLSTNSLDGVQPVPFAVNSDDVTYVPGADAASDRLAFLDGTNTGSPARPTLVYYNTAEPTIAPTGLNSFKLPLGAKGLVHLSAADAALFSPNATGAGILVASSPETDPDTLQLLPNRLSLFSLTGTLIAESTLISGTNFVGRFGNLESLAFDSVTKTLFLGDEQGTSSQIATLTIPAPGSALAFGLAAAALRRRRR